MIKFRADSVMTGQEIIGYYKYQPYLDIHTISVFKEDPRLDSGGYFEEHEVIPETVAIYTTINDKKDVEIYGSIEIDGKMSEGGDRTPYGYVEYRDGCWHVVNSRGQTVDYLFMYHGNIEVIGRQYENNPASEAIADTKTGSQARQGG